MRKAIHSGVLAVSVLGSAAAYAQSARIDVSKTVDLTHTFDESTIYWPTAKSFEWQKESWGVGPGGYWYTAGRYSASEHGGTHVDAPIHFGKGKQTLDELRLDQLIALAVVIDISKKCEANPDQLLTAADITGWEQQHGRLPEKSIALIRTGWGRYWPDKRKYLGSDGPGDTAHLHFPGISREAAELLVQRRVAGVGLDTASLDHGASKDFIAHQVLNGANVYGLENVANLERLPAVGATLIALPMKIKGGTGGPVRIIAVLP
ncbi:MAG: cyclase [Anaeromyxobacter sp. RBG_16_69_14]|nr:MAG: cyclase [Anaeromyxobacter sp. RBG_16_69_14]